MVAWSSSHNWPHLDIGLYTVTWNASHDNRLGWQSEIHYIAFISNFMYSICSLVLDFQFPLNRHIFLGFKPVFFSLCGTSHRLCWSSLGRPGGPWEGAGTLPVHRRTTQKYYAMGRRLTQEKLSITKLLSQNRLCQKIHWHLNKNPWLSRLTKKIPDISIFFPDISNFPDIFPDSANPVINWVF